MPTPIPPPLRDGVLYIDNSSMELFSTCRRQMYYNQIRRIELNKEKIALNFGSAFHHVLEHLYKTYGTAYRGQTQNAEIINLAYKGNFYDSGTIQVLQTPEDDYRTIPYLVQGVSKYLSDYPAEPFTLATMPSGQPGVEVPFAFPLGTITSRIFGTIPIVWTGRLDLVYRLDGRLGLLDHKTTSMMGPQFFAEFDIAHQFYGYAAALEYILGETVHEVMINGLGCRKPTRTGVQFEFNRHIIPINRDLLDEWHTDSLALVANYIQNCEEGYFPKQTKWCIGKYGSCQYRGLCTLPPSSRESAINTSEFRTVTWDPLNKQ